MADDLKCLVESWLAGDVTADDQRRIMNIAQSDEAFDAFVKEQAFMHAAMRAALCDSEDSVRGVMESITHRSRSREVAADVRCRLERADRRRRSKSVRRKMRLASAKKGSSIVLWLSTAAGIAILGVVIALAMGRGSERLILCVAEATGTAMCRDHKIVAGDRIIPGDWIELEAEASVRLNSSDGTSIVLEGPASCELVDTRRGRRNLELLLVEGRLRAGVRPQSRKRPMVVDTRLAYIEVVGTQFVVRAQELKTRLDVQEGLVRFHGRLDDRVKMVGAGQWAEATAAVPVPVTRPRGESIKSIAAVAGPKVDPATTCQATGFTLYDTVGDRPIRRIMDGGTIRLSELPGRKFTIRVDTEPKIVGRVEVSAWREGELVKENVEEVYPYFVTRDKALEGQPGHARSWSSIEPGQYEMRAVPYDSQGRKGGGVTIRFWVKDG